MKTKQQYQNNPINLNINFHNNVDILQVYKITTLVKEMT